MTILTLCALAPPHRSKCPHVKGKRCLLDDPSAATDPLPIGELIMAGPFMDRPAAIGAVEVTRAARSRLRCQVEPFAMVADEVDGDFGCFHPGSIAVVISTAISTL